MRIINPSSGRGTRPLRSSDFLYEQRFEARHSLVLFVASLPESACPNHCSLRVATTRLTNLFESIGLYIIVVLRLIGILLEGGLEPPHLAALPPQSSVSTNSTIRAGVYVGQVRKTGSFVKEMNFLLSLLLVFR